MQKLGYFTNQILKICKIHRKLRVELMSVLFCKYLRNQSSDLYEILHGGQSLSWKLTFKTSWWSVDKCARMSCKRTRARFIASARVYGCGDICKTKLTLVQPLIFYAFSVSSNFQQQSSPKIWKIYETARYFWRHNFKMSRHH